MSNEDRLINEVRREAHTAKKGIRDSLWSLIRAFEEAAYRGLKLVLGILDEQLRRAEAANRDDQVIYMLVLEVLAQQAMGQMDQAMVLLERALAVASKHLCPAMLGQELEKFSGSAEVFISHVKPGDRDVTMREVLRCTRDDIRINTFMLDATGALRSFIEQLTRINHGRAFFTTPETLGEYVLVDFLDHKRTISTRGNRRRAG